MSGLPGRMIVLVMASTSLLVTSACSDDPSSLPRQREPVATPSPIVSLEISSPRTLLVGAFAPFAVTAHTAGGVATPLEPGQVQWASSDTAIARISAAGFVSARSRGTVTITAKLGAVTKDVSLRVAPRVVLSPFAPQQLATLAVDDTVQLNVVVHLDIHGNTVSEPHVIWSSSHPDVVSVSATGLVVARHASYTYEETFISATTADGVVETRLHVVPASNALVKVRFVHAASSLGPLTFVPNKGTAVTLEYGQAVERSVSAGALQVTMSGFPRGKSSTWQGFADFIAEKQSVTLYASGDTSQAFLIPALDTHPVVRSDRSLVRIVMASSWGETSWICNVHLVAPGAALPGSLRLDDFYLPAISEYILRPAEEFDIVKVVPVFDNPAVEVARLRAKPEAGLAMTFVVTGHSRETMRLLSFIDP